MSGQPAGLLEPPAAAGRVLRAVRLLWGVSPWGVGLLALLLAVQGALPAAAIAISQRTIDALTAGGQDPLFWVGAWAGAQLLGGLFGPFDRMLRGELADRFTAAVNLRLIEKAGGLAGLGTLEDPAYHDDLEVLSQGARSYPLNLIVNLVFLVRDAVTLAALALLLGAYAPWMPLLLLAAALPLARSLVTQRDASYRAVVSASPDARAMNYHGQVALGLEHAAEVRLWNLTDWLASRYRRRFGRVFTRMRRVRREALGRSLAPLVLFYLAAGFSLGWAVRAAEAGALSVGAVVLVLQGVARMQSSTQGVVESLGYLFERSLFFGHLFRFLEAEPQVRPPAHPQPVPERPEIAFENVGFVYPDGRRALADVSFRIPYGQTVALVGENGAGKTTLVKLLLRFYDPSEGRVVVDGVDLRELDPAEWRRRVSAVFQSFGRYAFTLGENVGLADLARLDDEEGRAAALQAAGLGGLPGRLPEGWATPLSRAFGGSELSGGEWQKLAIARALFREAEVLILDEPTAALDARAERRTFHDFARLARRRTALLISHRLASVREADRLLVLKEGRLVEDGGHDELLAQGGEYAELWRLQAERYKDAGVG
ncbi:ABC transporter ATP-binding protein [Oceanithermus sp.]